MKMKNLLLFLVLCSVLVTSTCSENKLVRVKRSRYYPSPPSPRYYRKPPFSPGIFSYTPPPGYPHDEEAPHQYSRPRRPQVSKAQGLGDEDINNIVKYLSKQDLDKIIEFASEKERDSDRFKRPEYYDDGYESMKKYKSPHLEADIDADKFLVDGPDSFRSQIPVEHEKFSPYVSNQQSENLRPEYAENLSGNYVEDETQNRAKYVAPPNRQRNLIKTNNREPELVQQPNAVQQNYQSTNFDHLMTQPTYLQQMNTIHPNHYMNTQEYSNFNQQTNIGQSSYDQQIHKQQINYVEHQSVGQSNNDETHLRQASNFDKLQPTNYVKQQNNNKKSTSFDQPQYFGPITDFSKNIVNQKASESITHEHYLKDPLADRINQELISNKNEESKTEDEEELPKPSNLREDNIGADSKTVQAVLKPEGSYKLENFADLPLMDYYDSKRESVSSYHVPHYTITNQPSQHNAPNIQIEKSPDASAARAQSDAHLRAVKIWTHRSRGAAYTLNNDGTLSVETHRPKNKYGYP